jgi:hypothetical protein
MTDIQNKSPAVTDFADDPAAYFDYSYTCMHSLERSELEMLQLAALKQRFSDFFESIPMVRKLAENQGIKEIETLEDVVPLLFERTLYKSYPSSLLEKNRFDALTRWLDKLTSHDLSHLDTSSCSSIDGWVEFIEQETPLKLTVSMDASGVMVFLPISKKDFKTWGKTLPACYLQKFGDPPANEAEYLPNMHVVSPLHRHGSSPFLRFNDIYAEFFAGGNEEKVHTLHPGSVSSDMQYLAARLRVAKAKGNYDDIQVNPKLLEQKEAFEAQQANMLSDMESFYESIVQELSGERVFMTVTWNMLLQMAQNGMDKGLHHVFAPDSVIVSGGGGMGMVRPDNWEQIGCEFTGVEKLVQAYSMSEVCATHTMCEHRRFHISPWTILFVLDPDTNTLLPRNGVVTGRAAFFDLSASSRWGGFATGDEVTVHWESDCPCGNKSAYIEDNITMYKDKKESSDKITCAASPDAEQEALDFLSTI